MMCCTHLRRRFFFSSFPLLFDRSFAGTAATSNTASTTPAQKVVDEIKAAGGKAVANYDNVEVGAEPPLLLRWLARRGAE